MSQNPLDGILDQVNKEADEFKEKAKKAQGNQVERICENCQWWERGLGVLGFCKRNPPLFIGNDLNHDGSMIGMWPQTSRLSWCGEFRPKEQ